MSSLIVRLFDSDPIVPQQSAQTPVGTKLIRPDQIQRVGRVLLELDAASRPEDMNISGYRFHALHGRPKRYSVTITRMWRITFEWDGEDAIRVDYEDYH